MKIFAIIIALAIFIFFRLKMIGVDRKSYEKMSIDKKINHVWRIYLKTGKESTANELRRLYDGAGLAPEDLKAELLRADRLRISKNPLY